MYLVIYGAIYLKKIVIWIITNSKTYYITFIFLVNKYNKYYIFVDNHF